MSLEEIFLAEKYYFFWGQALNGFKLLRFHLVMQFSKFNNFTDKFQFFE